VNATTKKKHVKTTRRLYKPTRGPQSDNPPSVSHTMARAPSSSSLLLLLLVAAAATSDGAASGARRKAFENGLGRTPQMGYVTPLHPARNSSFTGAIATVRRASTSSMALLFTAPRALNQLFRWSSSRAFPSPPLRNRPRRTQTHEPRRNFLGEGEKRTCLSLAPYPAGCHRAQARFALPTLGQIIKSEGCCEGAIRCALRTWWHFPSPSRASPSGRGDPWLATRVKISVHIRDWNTIYFFKEKICREKTGTDACRAGPVDRTMTKKVAPFRCFL
jgi:hypothetical protein